MRKNPHCTDSSQLSRRILDSITGTLVCGWFAVTNCLIGDVLGHPVAMVLAFVIVIGWVAHVWNLVAAMLGLASATIVFCLGLFSPLGSLEVSSPAARAGLFWMLICGCAAAYVFARQAGGQRDLHNGGESC